MEINGLFSDSNESTSIISQLALSMVERVAKSNKSLADLMLAAAIPHRFTLEILEAIRLGTGEEISLKIALEQLRRLSFVKEIEPEVFMYHEEVRDAILHFWRSGEQRQQYIEYSDKLRIFFAEYGQISEMLYHWLAVESELAFMACRHRIQALIDRRDILECELLIRFAKEQVWSKTSLHVTFLSLAEITLNLQLDKWEQAVVDSQKILSTEITKEIKAIALLNLGTGLNYLGKWFEAKDHLEEATKLFLELEQPVPDAFLSLGWSYFRLGKQADALRAFQDALSLAQAIGHLPAKGGALNSLGAHYFSTKQWIASEKYYEMALKVRQTIDGGDFSIGRSFQNLANVYLKENNIEKAISHAEKALSIQEKMDDQFGISFSLEIMGVAFEKIGSPEKAIEFLERSLSIRRYLSAKKEIADTLTILSRIYEIQGEKTKSENYLIEANALRSELYHGNP